jgi:hypothetical protein
MLSNVLGPTPAVMEPSSPAGALTVAAAVENSRASMATTTDWASAMPTRSSSDTGASAMLSFDSVTT